MKSTKGTLVLLLAVVVILMTTVSGALQNLQPNKGAKPNLDEIYRRYPAVDFSTPAPESVDPKVHARRLSKNNRYDNKHFVAHTPAKGLAWFGNDWDSGLTGIPVNRSDAVVVGEVLGAQAYLSQDKGSVYSEFSIRVEDVLKDGSVTPGSTITGDRVGGVVKYDGAHTVLYRLVGQDLPHVGGRYVFFLKSTGEANDYSILLGYELRSGKVFLLDEIPVTAAYKGMDSSSFLNVVKECLGGSK